jgi:hypothetical protein
MVEPTGNGPNHYAGSLNVGFEENQSNLRLISFKVSGRSFRNRFFCNAAGLGRVEEKTTC